MGWSLGWGWQVFGRDEFMLELDDIQSGVLRPRPTPYVATYIAFRIDDRQAGRELMRRIQRSNFSGAIPKVRWPTPG